MSGVSAARNHGFVEENRRRERWQITKAGFEHIGALIDEADPRS